MPVRSLILTETLHQLAEARVLFKQQYVQTMRAFFRSTGEKNSALPTGNALLQQKKESLGYRGLTQTQANMLAEL